jgi:hypothetical protein
LCANQYQAKEVMKPEETTLLRKGILLFHTGSRVRGVVVDVTPICVSVEWEDGHESYMHPHDMSHIKFHSSSTEMLRVQLNEGV